MNSWLRIIRPINGIMGIVATWISAFIGVGLALKNFLPPVIFASLAVFLVTSAGNIINDIMDIETDKVNHPTRPLVKGEITVKQATYGAAILFIVPILTSAFYISYFAAIVVLIADALLVGYEKFLKKRGISGNITISILVGLIFIFGGIAVSSLLKMIILFGMASLANLSREIIKDIEDMEGDVDRITFPKRYGIKNAMILAALSVLIAVSLSYLPYYLGIFSIYYAIVVILSDALFIISLSVMSKNPERSQSISKYAMIVGLISFAVGGIA